MTSLAIIPARGGSKRIPRKNIKEFLGKPIIAYSIEAAIASGCFDEVIVSTDDDEIAEIAKRYGAKVPFMRSTETSSDIATTYDVLAEVINEYKKRGSEFSLVCCIYPTAPFITPEKLKKAKQMIMDKNTDAVVPVVRFSFPIQRAFKIQNDLIEMIYPEYMMTRSQDLPVAYHDAGQFYFVKTEEMLTQKKLFCQRTTPFEMPESEVQDIDNEEDWKIAEMKYSLAFLKKEH